jgi:hypothetical protein
MHCKYMVRDVGWMRKVGCRWLVMSREGTKVPSMDCAPGLCVEPKHVLGMLNCWDSWRSGALEKCGALRLEMTCGTVAQWI